MHLECLEECRVPHEGREFLFEETDRFGYVYEVDNELGQKVLATGKCQQLKDYKGPVETPTSSPVPA